MNSGNMRAGGFLIAKIHQNSDKLFSKILKEYSVEINPAQGRILFALWSKDRMTIGEISDKTKLERSTLTSMLDRLETSGFVKRVYDNNDRRTVFVERTGKDRTLEKKYTELSKKMTDIFYRDFTESEIERFEKNLEKILNNLDSPGF